MRKFYIFYIFFFIWMTQVSGSAKTFIEDVGNPDILSGIILISSESDTIYNNFVQFLSEDIQMFLGYSAGLHKEFPFQ